MNEDDIKQVAARLLAGIMANPSLTKSWSGAAKNLDEAADLAHAQALALAELMEESKTA